MSAVVAVRPASRSAGSPFGIAMKMRNVSTLTKKSTMMADASRRLMNAAKPTFNAPSGLRARGSNAWRRPSPKMFTDSTASTSMRPGTNVRCGALVT